MVLGENQMTTSLRRHLCAQSSAHTGQSTSPQSATSDFSNSDKYTTSHIQSTTACHSGARSLSPAVSTTVCWFTGQGADEHNRRAAMCPQCS